MNRQADPTPLDEAVRAVTNEEDVRSEIQALVAKKADFVKRP